MCNEQTSWSFIICTRTIPWSYHYMYSYIETSPSIIAGSPTQKRRNQGEIDNTRRVSTVRLKHLQAWNRGSNRSIVHTAKGVGPSDEDGVGTPCQPQPVMSCQGELQLPRNDCLSAQSWHVLRRCSIVNLVATRTIRRARCGRWNGSWNETVPECSCRQDEEIGKVHVFSMRWPHLLSMTHHRFQGQNINRASSQSLLFRKVSSCSPGEATLKARSALGITARARTHGEEKI